MAAFQILDHLDKLEPDGGRDSPSGDRSYKCPACGADNFKVNHRNGKWDNYSCECSKAEIRNAINPAINPNGTKQQRPKQQRRWEYVTPITHERGQAALAVHRIDDGNGTRKIWQESLIDGHRVAAVKEKVLPYRLAEALKELGAGAAHIYWVEGEPCVDRLWELGLPAVTSIGGAGKFNAERDAGHIPPERLVVVPDRDQPGVKHMEQVAAAHPGCQWLYPFPGTSQWNGSCPKSGGIDIADWIDAGATINNIVAGIGPKLQHHPEPQPDTEDERSADEAITEKINELLDLKLQPHDTWAKEKAIESGLYAYKIRKDDIDRRVYEALAQRWGLAISQAHAGKRSRRSANQVRESDRDQQLVHGFVQHKRDALIFGSAGAGKTTAGVGLAWSVITGEPFLDSEVRGEITGKVLWIGSDGGDGAYAMWQNAAEDFGIANDPRWIDGCFFWGADQQEGMGAWSVTPACLKELKDELESDAYALVIFDSWKAVCSLAGIDFGIGPVEIILRLLQALVGKHCSSVYLHHPSGNSSKKGVAGTGGNQNINQIPYAVHELREEPATENNPPCVRWLAHKVRGYQRREFAYRLTDEGFRVTDGEMQRNISDQVLITIGDIRARGTGCTSAALLRLMPPGTNDKTVRNNLTRMRQSGLISKNGSSWDLTPKGKRHLEALLGGG